MDNLLENEIAELVIQKQEIAEKWDKYGLLKNEEDPWGKLDLAVLLENQRLDNSDLDDYDGTQFKRISIPMVIRIWNGLIARDIISTQAFLKKTDNYYHLDYNDNKQPMMKKSEATTKELKLKAVWSLEATQNLISCNNIDAEAELTAILTQEIVLETDRRVLTNLRKNAGTNVGWDFCAALGDTIMEKYEALYLEVANMSRMIETKTRRGKANWMVTSPEISSIFETCNHNLQLADHEWQSSLGVQHVGTIGKEGSAVHLELYKDPLFPSGQILMGYKGNHPYDSGCFFCPRLLVKQTPTVLDPPDSFCPRKGLLMDFAHRLIPGGEDFYGVINVRNFII